MPAGAGGIEDSRTRRADSAFRCSAGMTRARPPVGTQRADVWRTTDSRMSAGPPRDWVA